MQENKSSTLFLPLKICQRLFSFIFNNLIPRGLKQATTCHSLRQASTTAPIVAAELSDYDCDSGLKVQLHYNKSNFFSLNEQVREHDEDNLVLSSSVAFDAGSRTQLREVEPILKTTVHESAPKKGLRFRGVEEEERIRKMKGKSIVSTEETRLPSPPPPPMRRRQVRPLFDVAVNINEKSDAFIRSRKAAMRRNFIFERESF